MKTPEQIAADVMDAYNEDMNDKTFYALREDIAKAIAAERTPNAATEETDNGISTDIYCVDDSNGNRGLDTRVTQPQPTNREWPTQKQIDDSFVNNEDKAESCRSWRAGVRWLRDFMTDKEGR